VQPGQRVMFEHGSLQGGRPGKGTMRLPSAVKVRSQRVSVGAKRGAGAGRLQQPPQIKPREAGQAATTLVYKSSEPAPQSVAIPQPPASPVHDRTRNSAAQPRRAKETRILPQRSGDSSSASSARKKSRVTGTREQGTGMLHLIPRALEGRVRCCTAQGIR
jgi:hypothetical protein